MKIIINTKEIERDIRKIIQDFESDPDFSEKVNRWSLESEILMRCRVHHRITGGMSDEVEIVWGGYG